MLRLYEKYLEAVDEYLEKCFSGQKPFIKCSAGCANCCEIGEYPISRLEMEYLMEGFLSLPLSVKNEIKANIRKMLAQKAKNKGRFLHRCPFLSSEKRCFIYERRGIICRAHGLAYFEEVGGQKVVKLPECSRMGLNYSETFDGESVSMERFKAFGVDSPIKHPLDLNFFEKDLLKGFAGIEFGEIRPMLEWFN